MSHFNGGSKYSSAQGYFSCKYRSCWIEVESSQTLQVYLSSNLSHFTTNTRSGRRNWNTAEVADRWWGQKGELKEPGKRLGMKDKWEERARTNFKNWTCRGSMCILEEGIVISRLARIKQDRGRTDWRAEAEDRKKKTCWTTLQRELFASTWRSTKVRPQHEAFKLLLREKVACFGQGTLWERKLLRAATEPSTE